MCARCDELEDELAYLRSELGLRIEASDINAVHRALKVRPGPARILLALHAARGRVVTKEQLEEAVPAKNGERDRLVVDVYVCALRKVLGADAIITAWGKGYALTAAASARIAQVLQPPAIAAQ